MSASLTRLMSRGNVRLDAVVDPTSASPCFAMQELHGSLVLVFSCHFIGPELSEASWLRETLLKRTIALNAPCDEHCRCAKLDLVA